MAMLCLDLLAEGVVTGTDTGWAPEFHQGKKRGKLMYSRKHLLQCF